MLSRGGMTKRALTAVAAAFVLFSAGRARAQSAQDKAGAEVLFEEGKALMKDKKYGLACPKFLESNRLDTGLGTMLWLADCYDKNGQSASAWGEFREAVDVAAKNHDAREKIARDRSNKLEAMLSRMTILVAVPSQLPGMVVKRDNVEVGSATWGEAVPVDPGAHTVTVSAPRKKPWETTVQVQRGVKNLDVHVPALEDAPVPVVVPPPPVVTGPGTEETPQSTERGSRSSGGGSSGGGVARAFGGIMIGLGVAGEGASVGLYLFAKQELDASDAKLNGKPPPCPNPNGTGTQGCNQQGTYDRQQAQNATTGEIAAIIGGGALIVGGIVLIVLAPGSGSGGRSNNRLVPWVGPGVGGLSFQGTW
jgi:hypothetical protein